LATVGISVESASNIWEKVKCTLYVMTCNALMYKHGKKELQIGIQVSEIILKKL
jgi:hypothetical protein